jgi:hypothetical protein
MLSSEGTSEVDRRWPITSLRACGCPDGGGAVSCWSDNLVQGGLDGGGFRCKELELQLQLEEGEVNMIYDIWKKERKEERKGKNK